jgi:hypothetical protein
MTTLSNTSKLIRAPGLIATDMDGETVMMDMETGAYFGLSGVGGRVWDLLAEPHSPSELAEVLVSEFDVDPETCRADLQQFLESLIENDLVRLV